MSGEPTDPAVTGKPMDRYEPYVELVTQVLANGLALAHDREFIRSLDLTLPIHEAVRDAARDSIKWRFAFDIDRIESERAGVVAEEPEWEYRTLLDGTDPQPHGRLSRGEITPAEWFAARQDDRDLSLERRTPAVPAGPWVPVEQGETDA